MCSRHLPDDDGDGDDDDGDDDDDDDDADDGDSRVQRQCHPQGPKLTS